MQEALDWLYSQKKSRPRTDLSRIRKCIELLKIQMPYDIVHIAGTNGKGSTAKTLETLLKVKGKTGLFISPYVLCFNERIQVNGKFISDEDVLNSVKRLKSFSFEYQKQYHDTIPFFELVFLMALLYFEQQKVRYAVIECGLGGRLDPTNVVSSTVSVITGIGLDHMNLLGNTKEEIAFHKMGIMKPDRPCFVCVEEELKPLFSKYASQVPTTISFVNDSVFDIRLKNATFFRFGKEAFHTPLEGIYQAYNTSLAIAVFRWFFPNESKRFIQKRLKEVTWPARFEKLKDHPLIYLDGAHNIQGMEALVESIKKKKIHAKIYVFFSALKDKDFGSMIQKLDEISSYYYFTSVEDSRKISPEVFAHSTRKPYEIVSDWEKVLCDFQKEHPKDVLLITGSLHFASQIRPYLK